MDTANPTEADLSLHPANTSVAKPNATIKTHLPPLRPKLPLVWFLQIEAQFQLTRIISQPSCYLHVVSCLPSETSNELGDTFIDSPEEDQYSHFKAIVLTRKPDSVRSRLQQLLTTKELADLCPAQLQRRERQLL